MIPWVGFNGSPCPLEGPGGGVLVAHPNGTTPRHLGVRPLGDIPAGLAPLLRILCAMWCVGSAPAPGVGGPRAPRV